MRLTSKPQCRAITNDRSSSSNDPRPQRRRAGREQPHQLVVERAPHAAALLVAGHAEHQHGGARRVPGLPRHGAPPEQAGVVVERHPDLQPEELVRFGERVLDLAPGGVRTAVERQREELLVVLVGGRDDPHALPACPPGRAARHGPTGHSLDTAPVHAAIYCMPIPQESPAVRRSLLRDDVFGRLRDAIVDGTFAPGEQLRDLELATWLGVSRTPVREALLRLAEAGLVVARPGRSTVVTPLDLRAVRDARDVVAAMHEVAVRAAVDRLTERDLAAMRDANERFEDALRRGDVDAAIRADDELHGVPVTVAANAAIEACSTSSPPSCAGRSGSASPRSPAGARWPGTTS